MRRNYFHFCTTKLCAALAAVVLAANSPGISTASSDIVVVPARINAAIASLDRIASGVERRSGVPGMAIAVVHGGKVVYMKGFGVRKVGSPERVDADTVFQLASFSKSLASTVVAGAVGAGKLKWDDPVAKYIPGFTLSDPWVGSHVTIADMFAHRSDLPEHAGDLLEDLGYGRMDIIRRLAQEPLDPFRVTYHYTNFGLTAAAQAAAIAEGDSWESLSQRLLYGPLGMTRTSSRWADFAASPDHATLHIKVHGAWRGSSREPDAQSPAGGASSTVRDLAKWMMLEMDIGKYHGKQVIARDPLLRTQQPAIVSNAAREPFARSGFYGLGMNVGVDDAGRVHLSHSGAFSMGTGTSYEMLPSESLGIVILTNGAPSGVPEAIAKTFMDRVEFGKETRDWYGAFSNGFKRMMADQGELVGKPRPAHPAAAQPLESYAGTYENPYYGEAAVQARHGKLLLSLGPKKRTYTLSHWSGNVFTFVPLGESSAGINAVTFKPMTGGGATLAIEYLDKTGLGTFTRKAYGVSQQSR